MNFCSRIHVNAGISEKLFRYEVFKLLRSEGKISDAVIENMMGWRHRGFNVFCGPTIWPRDEKGLENLAHYIIRASFSQERMTYIPAQDSADGKAKVTYESKDGKISKTFDALGLNRSTVSRNKAIYEHGGALGLITDIGKRGAYKLEGEKIQTDRSPLEQGWALRKIGEAVGVTEGCLRYAIRKGTLVRKSAVKSTENANRKNASKRCWEDCQSAAGIGVKRETERVLAAVCKLTEAAPVFAANESVRYAGVLLALPVLIQLGLLDAAQKADMSHGRKTALSKPAAPRAVNP